MKNLENAKALNEQEIEKVAGGEDITWIVGGENDIDDNSVYVNDCHPQSQGDLLYR